MVKTPPGRLQRSDITPVLANRLEETITGKPTI
jgi:hypothetical protein